MSKVCLISVTPDAEKTIGYIARVSNPKNQDNPNVEGLLKYCIKHGHWSIFEQATMTLQIHTTRGLAAQILRHRSFCFQEFSQRYADTNLLDSVIPVPELRSQDNKNRQNSVDDIPLERKHEYHAMIEKHFSDAMNLYNSLLAEGVAKECARFVLPLATPTKIYMTGSVRSWIHYINLRSSNGTQQEHMDIANLCKQHFICEFPTISKALDWCEDDKCECADESDDRCLDWSDLPPSLRID
tara:strand:- start:1342 stop:2064 length:723 start_codon:yes stop_codon:yes gene_type:complete